MRIAIVGAGISGLVVAHLLHGDHEITVFESGAYAGGHTNTIRVDTAEQTHHIDTGFKSGCSPSCALLGTASTR
jgi:uncharacterized protein